MKSMNKQITRLLLIEYLFIVLREQLNYRTLRLTLASVNFWRKAESRVMCERSDFFFGGVLSISRLNAVCLTQFDGIWKPKENRMKRRIKKNETDEPYKRAHKSIQLHSKATDKAFPDFIGFAVCTNVSLFATVLMMLNVALSTHWTNWFYFEIRSTKSQSWKYGNIVWS